MKQSDIAQQLGNMISQQTMHSGNMSIDENIPAELEEPAPVFEVDYKGVEASMYDLAFETIKIIVKSVVPEHFQNNEMLKNKMKLDATQLGMLYYQQKTTNIALIRSMDIIATGSTDPKMFAVIEKFQNRLQKISEQITDIQNQFRKYYIDSYLDLESKSKADEFALANGINSNMSIGNNSEVKAQLMNNAGDGVVNEDGSVKFTGTKSSVQEIANLKKARLKAQMEAEAEIIS